MAKQITLATVINDVRSGNGNGLSENDVEQLADIFCKRCRADKWRRFRSCLTYGLGRIENCGIFDRVQCEVSESGERVWHYVAGQSYPDEIRTVRELIVK